MPETLTPQIEGVSEEALKERIHLRRVKESVDMFDQLVQAGMWSPAGFGGGASAVAKKTLVAGTGYRGNFIIMLLPFTTD